MYCNDDIILNGYGKPQARKKFSWAFRTHCGKLPTWKFTMGFQDLLFIARPIALEKLKSFLHLFFARWKDHLVT